MATRNQLSQTWTDLSGQISFFLSKDGTGFIDIQSTDNISLYYFYIQEWYPSSANSINIIFGSSVDQKVSSIPNPITININYSSTNTIIDNKKDIITYTKKLIISNFNFIDLMNTNFYADIISIYRCINRT